MKMGIDINANIINWAISRAGYKHEDFALMYPYVQDWLSYKKKPTLKQLENFSNKVHLPFGYLFLEIPPQEQIPIPFFRTGNTNKDNVSINVYDTILLMQRRQQWLADYLKEVEYEELSFVGKFKNSFDYKKIVYDIRQTLGLDADWASTFQTWELALEELTKRIEEAGIIIMFNGIVENNTRRPILVDECRGFVLVDKFAPFMFINAADGKAAQMFTILHELAHIWTGNSAGFDFRQMLPANNPIEQLCDRVAAEFLVPEISFNRVWQERGDIRHLAKRFKVSPIVIARRALDLGHISKDDFFKFYNSYIDDLKFRKDNQSSGGNFYATQKKRLSLTFASYINQAVKENKLFYRDAYKMTGLKGDTYQNFMSKYLTIS